MQVANDRLTGARRPPRQADYRVLLTTEGTYPYFVGGVSSWCDLLVRGLPDVQWQIMPIVGGGAPAAPTYALPSNATLLNRVELWSTSVPSAGGVGAGTMASVIPSALATGLLGAEADNDSLVAAFLWCRRKPELVRSVFRSAAGWERFLAALHQIIEERPPGTGPSPVVTVREAAVLYQSLYWLARLAATPTPPADVALVTVAGWASVPAIVHKALHGTPVLLTEHGLYVREAYLAAAQSNDSQGARFISTSLARGLARAAYAAADIISPVTEANVDWQVKLGADREKIHPIVNGIAAPAAPKPPPGTSTVVSVGRIDPLKDIKTMLRVASEVVLRIPEARFMHFGPVSAGQETYGQACDALHERLRLDDRFRFMGSTTDPSGVVRDADVVLMTSISEGMPMAILEAMGEGRPVVSTAVGGVRDVVQGCGTVAPAGDVHGLAMGVCTLLQRPTLARHLGLRGHARVTRRFSRDVCLSSYGGLLRAMSQALA